MLIIEITGVIFILYSSIILGLFFGWLRLKKREEATIQNPSVTIIVAFKDEQSNLKALVNSLSSLIYPEEKLEFIFSNDHSSDESLELLEKLKSKLSGRVIIVSNSESESGKKAALKTAALVANSDILCFTDADCQNTTGWIKSMVRGFNDPKIQMIQGPVLITENKTLISRIQQIEFLSLMQTSAGSIGNKHELLASGANLAIRKQTYLASLDSLKTSIHTGDDMFLLEYVKKQFKKGICFDKSHDSIINTPAVKNLNVLWNQRKRWSSKATNYSDWQIILTSIVVLFTNALILVLFLLSLFDISYLQWALGALIIKTLADSPLMIAGIKFYRINHGLKWFFLTQLIYPIYVTMVAFAGVFGNFTWKNRKGL